MSFIERQGDPLKHVPDGLNGEDEFKATHEALERGLSAGIKSQAEAFKEISRTDFFVCLCFEHSDQVDAFLRACKYPEIDVQFVDGTILAENLDIKLPPAPYRHKPLRPVDRTLARLVTMPRRLGA